MKRPKNPIKIRKKPEPTFLKKRYVTNNLMKRCPTLLVIKEVQMAP